MMRQIALFVLLLLSASFASVTLPDAIPIKTENGITASTGGICDIGRDTMTCSFYVEVPEGFSGFETPSDAFSAKAGVTFKACPITATIHEQALVTPQETFTDTKGKTTVRPPVIFEQTRYETGDCSDTMDMTASKEFIIITTESLVQKNGKTEIPAKWAWSGTIDGAFFDPDAGSPPAILSSSDTVYTLASDYTGVANGFNITGVNTTLDCQGHTFAGTNVTGSYGVYLTAENSTIRNCVINSFFHNIYSNGATNGTIENIISFSPEGNGLFVLDTRGFTISNVTIRSRSATYDGLKVQDSDFNSFHKTSTSATYGGPLIEGSSGNNMTNCTFTSPAANVMWFQDSTLTSKVDGNNIVRDSTMQAGAAGSVVLRHSSNNNSFFNNSLITEATGYAILFYTNTETNNTFIANNITSEIFVWDLTGGTAGVLNNSTTGNAYTHVNGTHTWDTCNISSSTAYHYANQGTDLPFDSSETCLNPAVTWLSTATDGHPWTNNVTSGAPAPVLNLISPLNTTYNISNVPFSYTAANAASCWYSLDSAANTTLASCANTTLVLANGAHTLSLYANNTDNAVVRLSANFSVNTYLGETVLIQCVFTNSTRTEGTANAAGIIDQTETGYSGLKLQANQNLLLNSFRFLTNDQSTLAYLLNASKDPIGAPVARIANVATFTADNLLVAGEYYYVVGDNGGAAYDGYYVSDAANIPKNHTNINLVGQIEDGIDRTYNYFFTVSSVTTTPITASNTSNISITYTILDSETLSAINASLTVSIAQATFSNIYSFTANSTDYICISPGTSSAIASINESFSALGYSSLFIQRTPVTYSLNSANYTIYMVPTNSTTAFQTIITVIDNNRAPLDGVFVQVSRQNITTNTYYQISYSETDVSGTTTQLLVPNSIFYKMSVYDSTGALLQTYSPQVISCNTLTQTVCNVVLVVGQITSIPYISTFNYANASCSWNNATGTLACTPSGLDINSTILEVALFNQTAYNSTICVQSGVGLAVVTCILPTDAGNCYNFAFRGTLNSGETPLLGGGQVCIAGRPTFTPNNGIGLLLTFILLAIGAILGLAFGASGTLIGMAFGLIIAVAFSFLTGIFWFAGIGGVAALLILAWICK